MTTNSEASNINRKNDGREDKNMKKLICFIISILVILIPTNFINAQISQNDVTATDVETLIEEKLNEEALTKEELTKAVLEMKDEKIENLEGNLSNILDTAGLTLAFITLFLTLVTGISGWLVKKSIDEKLTLIEEKEKAINKIHNDIKINSEIIEQYYKQTKEFIDEIDRIKKNLNKNERSLDKRESDLENLREYIGAIEDIANSSILVNQFLKEKSKALDIIDETKALLQEPLKYQEYVMLQLSQKLGMNNELNNLESITTHLKHLVGNLTEEEDNLWKAIQGTKANELYFNHDENSTTLYEEIKSILNDWNGPLDDILIIKNIWEKEAALNPIDYSTRNDHNVIDK